MTTLLNTTQPLKAATREGEAPADPRALCRPYLVASSLANAIEKLNLRKRIVSLALPVRTGFTLIELLVVIAIISILVGFATASGDGGTRGSSGDDVP